MFPCFISDENLEIVAPNDYLGGLKILELSHQRCIVQSLFCETLKAHLHPLAPNWHGLQPVSS